MLGGSPAEAPPRVGEAPLLLPASHRSWSFDSPPTTPPTCPTLPALPLTPRLPGPQAGTRLWAPHPSRPLPQTSGSLPSAAWDSG